MTAKALRFYRALQDNATSKENNSPNLALKSIIAIGAMAEMSRVNGNDSDAQLYGVSLFRRHCVYDTKVGSLEQSQQPDRAVAISGTVVRPEEHSCNVWRGRLVVAHI